MSQQPIRATATEVPDEILRHLHIDATAEAVFAIISEPGWFINDGEYREHEITRQGAVARVVDPVHGEFSIETVALDPPHRAVFRWLGGRADAPDLPVNTIEFLIEPDGSGVMLSVREQGFASMSADALERRRRFEENSQGWSEELALAKMLAEAA